MKLSANKFLSFLGLNRQLAGLLGMVILVGLGERMAERFLPIYLTALGGGVLSIGLLNGLDNFLSAFYAFPGGYLSTRLGAKKALLIFNLMAMAGFALVILIPRWQAVLAGAVLFLSWSAISLPASMSLIARVLPAHKRTMGVSMHSLVRRIPMALGPILGGLCISLWGEVTGVRLAFGFALCMALVALLLQQRFLPEKKENQSNNPDLKIGRGFSLLPPELRRLLLADILIRFCEQIPYAFVVIWAMRIIASPISAFDFGLLSALEMVTAMFIYVPVAHFADKFGKKPFVVITFVFFSLFPLALYFSRSFGALAACFVLRGLKEFGEPARKALIMDLAPQGKKALSFGTYYMFRDFVVSLAAFGGAFLWMISPEVNFFTAFGFGVLGTFVFAIWGREPGREREGRQTNRPGV
ncbi:MFS transporter [Dethiosulfatarculus sandiegensis]|uniref:MFS transporter n=1 Tax=Dethiosulfatarculus sandiegensis TaxID=1429043 RepID=A0A0D2HM81_9BACT|nr:MFS transporter [Dethiosulfatarculus sandiegensis]KIX11723.1 MFS transporter [Dethiosulfatarculus sandiegensis]